MALLCRSFASNRFTVALRLPRCHCEGKVIRFRSQRSLGAHSPAVLQLRGKSYPLPLSGSVWIDKQSGAVTRLTAAVDSSLNDLGLQGMRSDIHYSLIQFHDPDEAYWMPASA